MQVLLVDVISDTSFLIHLATNRITNFSDLEVDIGKIEFIVPKIVIDELNHLSKDDEKKQIALETLEFIKNFKTNSISGKTADIGILGFIQKNGGIVATMDKNLKNQIKELGSSILSMHNDKIVLEN